MRISIKGTDKAGAPKEYGQFFIVDGRISYEGNERVMSDTLQQKAIDLQARVWRANENPAQWLAALPATYSGSRFWAEEVSDTRGISSVPKPGQNASGAISVRGRF